MENCEHNTMPGSEEQGLSYDLGTFEGFNFRNQEALDHLATADEVIGWDHDTKGEAEFWPSGDNAGVCLVFGSQSSVTGPELIALDELLETLGHDSEEAYLQIYHALRYHGATICDLTTEQVEDTFTYIVTGDSFIDLRNDAAYDLFETYYPEAYQAWEKSLCDGLIFDVDRFLDSPSWSVEEVTIGRHKALIISLQ